MITIEKLLHMGVHLGHPVKQMNPKMKPYICGKKNELQLLDVVQGYWFLKRVCHFLLVAASKNKSFLFVSKKKIVAKRMTTLDHVFYVNQRWLGGLLTNWKTVRQCLHKLEALEQFEQSGGLKSLSKKEIAIWRRDFLKLQTNLGGLKGMTKLPDVVILLDQFDGSAAIQECKKLNIPTVQLLDTNSDPSKADLFVPFNDDCLPGLHFVLTAFLKSIAKGLQN